MIYLVIGGSGSGKSEYAESYIGNLEKNLAAQQGYRVEKYYIATMQVYDREAEKKVQRHRRMRAEKNFCTIEQPTNLSEAVYKIEEEEKRKNIERKTEEIISENSWKHTAEKIENGMQNGIEMKGERAKIALLECMSNLAANEMFGIDGIRKEDEVVEKIVSDVQKLSKALDALVIVTNNIFEDGVEYEEETLAYIRALGRINERLAEYAEEVVEVVVGIPLFHKKGVTS